MLIYPKQALYFSLTGLTLWYEKMIPTLLPFMIITNLMIEMRLTSYFVSFLRPILGPLFQLSDEGIYAMLVGFLCGFPMGARTIANLYQKEALTKKEATFLLSFCNNIGPIYFISFVLVTLQITDKTPYLFGMYGLPLLYGLFLRHTFYRKTDTQIQTKVTRKSSPNLLEHLDNSIMSGLSGIAKLGGYMIFFNLLNLVPYILFHSSKALLQTEQIINCLLEITSGIGRIQASNPFVVFILLPFGGFSCIAQTYSMIRDTDLSIGNYVFHKIILTLISILYYIVLLFF